MPSLLPHDLCHGRSASRWLPAVIEFQLSYSRSSLNMQYAGSQHSRSFSGGGGKPSFPSPSAGDLRELPRVPLRGEGSCGGGGAPRDSDGSGTTEEVLIWLGAKDLRLPLRFGLRLQGPCTVGTGESGLVLSEEGNPACLSSCSWGFRPLVKLCVESASFSRRCTGVSVTLRFLSSSTGLPSKRCPGIGFL